MSGATFIPTSKAMIKDDREAKLPAWAQGMLVALRRGVIERQQQLDDLKPNQVDNGSQMYWERSSLEKNPVYLPRRSTMVFDFGGQQDHWDKVSLHWDGPALSVRGGRALDIKPMASNAIELRLRSGY